MKEQLQTKRLNEIMVSEMVCDCVIRSQTILLFTYHMKENEDLK